MENNNEKLDDLLRWFQCEKWMKSDYFFSIKSKIESLKVNELNKTLVMPSLPAIEEIKLEPVHGSDYCQYSVIENKLEILYKNQEKLLQAIKLLGNGA